MYIFDNPDRTLYGKNTNVYGFCTSCFTIKFEWEEKLTERESKLGLWFGESKKTGFQVIFYFRYMLNVEDKCNFWEDLFASISFRKLLFSVENSWDLIISREGLSGKRICDVCYIRMFFQTWHLIQAWQNLEYLMNVNSF